MCPTNGNSSQIYGPKFAFQGGVLDCMGLCRQRCPQSLLFGAFRKKALSKSAVKAPGSPSGLQLEHSSDIFPMSTSKEEQETCFCPKRRLAFAKAPFLPFRASTDTSWSVAWVRWSTSSKTATWRMCTVVYCSVQQQECDTATCLEYPSGYPTCKVGGCIHRLNYSRIYLQRPILWLCLCILSLSLVPSTSD